MAKKTNQINKSRKSYFACANTCKGFVNLFNTIYNSKNLEKLYIIKGLGESVVLNEIAKKAEEKKYSVDYYLCPNDMDYLNGVIINELKTAVISEKLYMQDSVSMLKYPVILENIINLNDFYDEKKLFEQKQDIYDLNSKKIEYNKLAYKFLKAANELSENIEEISTEYIYYEKLNAFIDRIINKTVNEKHLHGLEKNKNIDEYKFINSISSNGLAELTTFEKEAKKIFYISNENFSGWNFTENIIKRFSNLCKVICPDALNPKKIKAIYLKNPQILFVIKNKDLNLNYDEKYNFINMERFIDKNLKKDNKQKLRFIQKCYKSISDETVKYFDEIKKINNSINDIYKNAINTIEKNKYIALTIKKIIS